MSEPKTTQTFTFPEKSKKTTDETFTFEEIRGLMDGLIFGRAEYVAELLISLKKRFGDEVFEIAKKTIYDIGYKRGQLIPPGAKGKDLASFLTGLAGSKFDKLYWGLTIDEQTDESITCHVEHCPLPRKWKQMGLSNDEMVEMCTIFDYIDKGLAAGYHEDIEMENTGVKTLGTEGYCRLTIRLAK